MSEQNVELLRQMAEAWNRGDLEWILDHISADFEYRPRPGAPDVKSVYRGRDGLREFWNVWRDAWESTTLSQERIVDLGEQVLVRTVQAGRGGGSGVEVSHAQALLWTIRDGVCVRGQSFSSWEEALKAAGLEE